MEACRLSRRSAIRRAVGRAAACNSPTRSARVSRHVLDNERSWQRSTVDLLHLGKERLSWRPFEFVSNGGVTVQLRDASTFDLCTYSTHADVTARSCLTSLTASERLPHAVTIFHDWFSCYVRLTTNLQRPRTALAVLAMCWFGLEVTWGT